MKWMLTFTILLSTILTTAFAATKGMPTVGMANNYDLSTFASLKISSLLNSFSHMLPISISMPCSPHKPKPQDRFVLINQKRAEAVGTSEVPEQKSTNGLQSSDSNGEKSSIGDTVKTVEKKWVKIVEIVVPIAVGLPLLIILGVCGFICCTGCRKRRQNKV